jgi:hypothetical protein
VDLLKTSEEAMSGLHFSNSSTFTDLNSESALQQVRIQAMHDSAFVSVGASEIPNGIAEVIITR